MKKKDLKFTDEKGKPINAPAEAVKALKIRHGLTYEAMANAVYGSRRERMYEYCAGKKGCKPITWWALVLHFEKIDLSKA